MIDPSSFLEWAATSGVYPLAAFALGAMASLSPCSLAENMTAVAYLSRRLGDSKRTLLVGSLYALGNVVTFLLLSSVMIYTGLSARPISMFLQNWGSVIIGPILLVSGLAITGKLKLRMPAFGGGLLSRLKKKTTDMGYAGAFGLGVLLGLTFCPFDAVLFFGMFMPMAISAGDAFFLPLIFSMGMALPVVAFAFVLSKGAEALARSMNKAKSAEMFMERLAGTVFIIIGTYYIFSLL